MLFTISGISGHDAISFEVPISLEKHKLQERKIFQYRKADEDEIYLLWLNFVKSFFWTGSIYSQASF